MTWQCIRISRFGGPEVLELAEQSIVPDPGPGEVRIKVLAAGTYGADVTRITRARCRSRRAMIWWASSSRPAPA